MTQADAGYPPDPQCFTLLLLDRTDTALCARLHACPAQDTPTVDKFAERLVQNVLGATETTSSMMLGLFYAVQMVPGLQVRAGHLGHYLAPTGSCWGG